MATSPFASQPPTTPTPARSESPQWHFPGPSSKYHQRERPRPTHAHTKSTYTPVGPVLSTEKRAHRRAQSYAQLPTTPSTPANLVNGIWSPPSSECGRRPLNRLSSLPASYTTPLRSSITMASAHESHASVPRTPAKSALSTRRGSAALQGSPFSDYFTDDARSSISGAKEQAGALPHETQALLVRLNQLQSQLIRGANAPDVVHRVGRRIAEVEAEIDAVHSQSRLPSEMEDSGLFMDDDDDEDEEDEERPVPQHRQQQKQPTTAGSPNEGEETDEVPEIEGWRQHRDDDLLVKAQEVLDSVMSAQSELKKRHQELRNLNEEHLMQIEEKEQEVEHLRAENEALRSDLGFDHSELLFLKLQMEGFEVDLADVTDDAVRKNLHSHLNTWRGDWNDVEARFKRRQRKYAGLELNKRDSRLYDDDETMADGGKDWTLQVDKRRGHLRRIDSITIRRVSKGQLDEEHEHDEAENNGEEDDVDNPDIPRDVSRPPTPPSSDPQSRADDPRVDYADQSTQTDLGSDPKVSAYDFGLDGTYDSDDDCAITTSPPTEAGEENMLNTMSDSDDAEIMQKQAVRRLEDKSAWEELWEGFTDWAGLADR